jgi:hypothetical protein
MYGQMLMASCKERQDLFLDKGVGEKIILKSIKIRVPVWIGFTWFKLGASNGVV